LNGANQTKDIGAICSLFNNDLQTINRRAVHEIIKLYNRVGDTGWDMYFWGAYLTRSINA